MRGSLKGVNALGLYGVVAANFVAFYGVLKNDVVAAGSWSVFSRGLGEALPAGIGLILTGILNAQLSAEAKARIVFLRWTNPLPGSEAFTRHGKSDPRVDLGALQRDLGPLPSDPRDQNALWYRLYRSVDAYPAVRQAHRAYLFARDYTCLALMMLLVLGGAGLLQIPSRGTALTYVAALTLQFVLAGRAARNHGRRLVTTVLAIKGAQL